jgi:glycosyltransferase involved in cell wall biosynthesis
VSQERGAAPGVAGAAPGAAAGPSLTLIVTALNEEDNIVPTITNALTALRDFGVDGEIVFIDDGSRDRTGEAVRAAFGADPRVRRYRHEAPHGVGASFWEGVELAGGDVVGWVPGDNEVDPWELLRYFGLLEHVDLVIPFIFNTGARSWFRRTLSSVYRFIINTTFRTNFNYTNGPILYRKSILKQLPYHSASFFFQTDALMRLTRAGYMFAEVPFIVARREHGISKAISFPSLWKVVKGYVRLVRDFYRHHPVASDISEGTQTFSRRE